MKKIFTLMLLAMACTMNIQAQEYNLFDPADGDADGWLWFDTDEKVEKYIGICDEYLTKAIAADQSDNALHSFLV